jgi:hypothetical protein
MKTIQRTAALLLLAATPSSGQSIQQTNLPPPTPYQVVNRNANTRTWERTVYELSSSGAVVGKPHRYVECASGLEFQSNGVWTDAIEKFQFLPGNAGAAATNGQHQAFCPADLAQGVIELVTPEGIHLKNRPIGLSYFDGTDSVMFASLSTNPVIGELLPSGNQVLYTNIFAPDSVNGDLLVTYHLSGTECDLILRSKLPDPAFWNMQSDSIQTRVQLLWEFFDAPAPKMVSSFTNTADGLVNSILGFDATLMMPGKTFAVGDLGAAAQADVYKTWYQNLEGHTILCEELPYVRIKPQLDGLAALDRSASDHLMATAARRRGISGRKPPPSKRTASLSSPPKMRLAKADVGREPGLGWAYTTLSGLETNYTFQADMTYCISSALNLWGTNTWEGNSVLKFASNASIVVIPGTPAPQVNFLTRSYRPAVFTAVADNSLGEQFGAGPLTAAYANPALNLPNQTAALGYARFAYAQLAISLGGSTLTASNIQVINCQKGVAVGGSTFMLRNALFRNVATNFTTGLGITIDCQNVTFANSAYLETVGSNNYVTLISTNSIFANVTNLYDNTPTGLVLDGDYNGFYQTTNFGSHTVTNSFYPFQTVGGSMAYLADGCLFRNAGTTNISTNLLADLQLKTTFPPIVYSNVQFYAAMTLGAQAQRDTDSQPDLGWHADPLDYCFGGCDAYANITFLQGTAVGWFRTTNGWYHAGQGIHLDNQKIATFSGTAQAPCYWVRCNVVQEGGTGLWDGGHGPGGITGWADQNYGNASQSPEVHLQFTHCSQMAGEEGNDFRDDSGYLIVRATHSEFWSGDYGGYVNAGYFTNCLMDRFGCGNGEGHPGDAFAFQNCTWHGGAIGINTTNHIPVWIHDCSFDSTSFSTLSSSGITADFNYNAFLTNDLPGGEAQHYDVTNFNWQTSWFGNYYLPTNSPLTNFSSITAASVGLYHFTTQTNQVPEGSKLVAQVDCGYHYVATDSQGNPLDLDNYWDGVPDYLLDANGNGQVDSGEIDWQHSNDPGLKVWITEPKSAGGIP